MCFSAVFNWTRKSHLDLYLKIGSIVMQFYYNQFKHPIKCEFKLKQKQWCLCISCAAWKTTGIVTLSKNLKIYFAYGCNFKCRLHPLSLTLYSSFCEFSPFSLLHLNFLVIFYALHFHSMLAFVLYCLLTEAHLYECASDPEQKPPN